MQSDNEPKLVPQEEVYLRLANNKITYEDHTVKGKIKDGNVVLTTHRILFFKQHSGLEIPLCYINSHNKVGNIFQTPGLKLEVYTRNQAPPYVKDYYNNILKRSDLPPAPKLSGNLELRFHDRTRDKFLKMLEEALDAKNWLRPIKTQSQRQEEIKEATKVTGYQAAGIAGYKRQQEKQSQYTQDQITGAFSDLESLKERSRQMVLIAESIKSKLARKELDADSEEMKEIQSVMFNMGIASDFSTTVSKDTSGKNYHQELAYEVEKFLNQCIDKFGGVVGLVDLYCMYNRARGTDLISPEDLSIACNKLNQTSQAFFLRRYPSGVQTIQSRMFNEDHYFQKISDTLAVSGPMTASKVAETMHVNVVLVKEQMQAAEEKGFVCRDESYEGVQYYDNKFKLLAV